MSILYCKNCGAKIEYTLQKPIACFKCNQELSSKTFARAISKESGNIPLKNSIRIKNISKKINVSASNHGDDINSVYKF